METGRDAMMLLSCVPCVIGGEKVASGSGESLGEGKVVRESSVSCSRVGPNLSQEKK